MTSLNSAFERLKETIPIFPYEKKLSRIQTLRLAIDYIEFMGSILHQPTENGGSSSCQQEHPTEDINLNNSAGQSPSSSTNLHLSPDCIQKFWHQKNHSRADMFCFVSFCSLCLFFFLLFFFCCVFFFGITMKGELNLTILAAIFMKLWTVFSIPIQSVSNSMMYSSEQLWSILF